MTLTTELLIWFGFVLPGLTFASLSLRRARFVLYAVRTRKAAHEVINDTQHVANTSLLLTLGWLVFVLIGVVAVLSPPPAAPRVVEPMSALILWGLLSALGVWSVMTIGDYLYTRRVWKRTTHTIQQEGPL